jgi:hypothetical protein
MNTNTHSTFNRTCYFGFIVMSWLKQDSISKSLDVEDSGLGSSVDNESICITFPSVYISRCLRLSVVLNLWNVGTEFSPHCGMNVRYVRFPEPWLWADPPPRETKYYTLHYIYIQWVVTPFSTVLQTSTHDVTSQKIILFMATAVRTSNSTRIRCCVSLFASAHSREVGHYSRKFRLAHEIDVWKTVCIIVRSYTYSELNRRLGKS